MVGAGEKTRTNQFLFEMQRRAGKVTVNTELEKARKKVGEIRK
jgi:hypothetical protein